MNSTGYHVVNLVLHIIETLLIWFILRKLSIPGAFLAALIFAVHPVNVETVGWIAQQKNLIAMLFLQFAILAYLKLEMPVAPPQNRLYRPAPAAGTGLAWFCSVGHAQQRIGSDISPIDVGNHLVAASRGQSPFLRSKNGDCPLPSYTP